MKTFNKLIKVVFIIFLINNSVFSQTFNIPKLSRIGEGGIVSAELIYNLDSKPTAQCHASSIIETSDGLMCAFFSGTHEKNEDVGIRVSHYKNGKWSWPVEVVNGFLTDSIKHPTWNPVLFRPKNGPIFLFYKVGPNVDTWWGMITKSEDEGKTWSKPIKMRKDKIVGDLLGPIKNKPIQLENGVIISPTSIESSGTSNKRNWRIYFELSNDNGNSWTVVPPINDGEEFDAIQPSVLVHKSGDLQILARTMQDVLVTSWSKDQGKTWSPLKNSGLPNPNSGTDAVTAMDGRHFLVYNHSTNKGEQPKGRNILNLAVSENGIDWKIVTTLENVPKPDGYSYPAIIQTTDGLLHITYTYNRRSIKHVVVDPKHID